MKGFFSPDAPLAHILSTLFDLMILNIVFVVCCLPVVTAGAAYAALLRQTFSLVKGGGVSVSKFFAAFRENAKNATLAWLAFLLITAVAYADIRMLQTNQLPLGGFVLVVVGALYLVCAAVMAYVIPLMVKFENTFKNYIVCAFFFAVSHLPATVLLLLLNAAPVAVFLFYPSTFLTLLPFWVLIAFSLASLGSAWLLTRCFRNYLPPDPNA